MPVRAHQQAAKCNISVREPLYLQNLKLFFPSRFATQKRNSPHQGNGCRIHGLSASKLVCIWSTIPMGFRYERWRILAHCGGETLQDDHLGLKSANPALTARIVGLLG